MFLTVEPPKLPNVLIRILQAVLEDVLLAEICDQIVRKHNFEKSFRCKKLMRNGER